MAENPETVDDYIASFDAEVQAMLRRVQLAIHAGITEGGARDAPETISYGIVRVSINGRYGIYFGAWKKHIGMYPVPVFEGELEKEIAPYRSGKDSVNFVYGLPLPESLITKAAAEITRRTLAR
ncbi:iron chaperone [Salinibacterium hongtaonis]|uniref:YdhG-like domain-containing protein n=1 Tax=Homoserinimonas hongtaonis TaxID=2079791 RepID=A0A2U1T1Q1_9MICO|nr:hypothetical protein [Salinibacterium hongtaonis]PWB97795.1 hypothetical protein DF220_08100 [Salinibacterium hongtaonis]